MKRRNLRETPFPEDIKLPTDFAPRQIGHLLRRAYAIAKRNSAESLSVLGDVSPVQASVLGALASGALTQAELGRRIGMEPANTHTIVRRLVASGLVRVRPDPANHRLVLVSLSADGAAVAARIGECIKVAHARTLSALGQDEQSTLLDMLARIVLTDAGAAERQPQERVATEKKTRREPASERTMRGRLKSIKARPNL